MTDVVIALRSLRKNLRFSLVAVLTLGVAIAACSALFSIYDRLVLHPITIANPSSLVAILNVNPQLNAPVASVSYPRYEHIRDHATSFASIGISAFDNFTITGEGDPSQLNGLRASASFFPTLGIGMHRGRNFTAEEDVPNGPAVCILSYELWQSRFGGRESVLNSTIQLNSQPWLVVGITPPRLSPPFQQTQVFAPRVFELTGLTAAQVQNGAGYAQPIARLKPGVTIAQASADLGAVAQAYKATYAGRLDANNSNVAQPFVDFLVGPTLRTTFYALLGAVAFVLLIACANIASLFLARLIARQKEIAIRQSLGAMRGRVVRQFLVESLVFSSIAGLAGTLLGVWALAGAQSLLSTQLPPNTTLTMTWTALAVTIALTLLSAIIVGLVPALHASRESVVDALKDQARGSSSHHGASLRGALIVAEVALSVVLLVGSAMLLLSFVRLQRTPPGFDPAGVGAAFVGLPLSKYSTPPQQAAFFDQVVDRLRAQGNVVDAAASNGLPISGFNPRSPYSVAGRPILPLAQRPLAGLAIVSESYFRTLGIAFAEGRAFTADDRQGAPGVCIVNESLARRLFPGESALGKVLLRGANAEVPLEIVGVIRDVKTLGLNVPAPDEVYLAMRQLGRPAMAVVARTTGDPNALQAAIRAAVASVDPSQPISFFATMDANIAGSLGVQRIVASLTGIFAAIALVLSAVGLYSVIAYAVSQRTAEIGIRMALGAQASQVVGLMMRSGLKLVAIGLAIGVVAAGGASYLIRVLLFQVATLDWRIYGAVAVAFALVAALACLMPSMRASKVDPLVALR
jgi:predicted permease